MERRDNDVSKTAKSVLHIPFFVNKWNLSVQPDLGDLLDPI